MSERALIRKFRAMAPGHPWLRVGPGDDCAILDWNPGRGLAFKIDQVVEGTHFLLKGEKAATAREVGWKAMAKTCSDLAATGYWPVAAMVSAAIPRNFTDEWVLELNQGLLDCCQRYAFAIAGGDIATGDCPLLISVSLLGEGPKGSDDVDGPWLRSGAEEGDSLLVTGTLGGSLWNKRHIDFIPRLHEAHCIREMAPSGIHACIDISDGLARDLGHLCDESHCGVVLEETALPIHRDAFEAAKVSGKSPLEHVLSDGEDFELLLAVEPRVAQQLMVSWKHETPLRKIGRVVAFNQGRSILYGTGQQAELPDCGFEHLTAAFDSNPKTEPL